MGRRSDRRHFTASSAEKGIRGPTPGTQGRDTPRAPEGIYSNKDGKASKGGNGQDHRDRHTGRRGGEEDTEGRAEAEGQWEDAWRRRRRSRRLEREKSRKRAGQAMRDEGEKGENKVHWRASGEKGWCMEDGTWEAGTRWAFPPERGTDGGAGPAWDEEVQMVSTIRAVLGYMMLVGEGERRTREAARPGEAEAREARGRWKGVCGRR